MCQFFVNIPVISFCRNQLSLGRVQKAGFFLNNAAKARAIRGQSPSRSWSWSWSWELGIEIGVEVVRRRQFLIGVSGQGRLIRSVAENELVTKQVATDLDTNLDTGSTPF